MMRKYGGGRKKKKESKISKGNITLGLEEKVKFKTFLITLNFLQILKNFRKK